MDWGNFAIFWAFIAGIGLFLAGMWALTDFADYLVKRGWTERKVAIVLVGLICIILSLIVGFFE